MPEPSSVIQLRDLSKEYRRSHLGRVTRRRGVEGLSFDVRSGEVFGLLGLNGSGKTTTIKLILGLLFPTGGAVRVDGHPAGSLEARRRVGYLPEVPYFYRYLTAREVLRFYGRLSEVPGRELPGRIDRVLAAVRMTAHADRPLREFSKGMLQRVGLAQAMLHEPPVMVLDEPVTGLDPLGLREMRELILSLNKAGRTIFFSSHSISEVEKVCHRVGILVKGKLVRLVDQKEWAAREGSLEDIFVQVVSAEGDAEVR
jgi:ABC-2 type transport system ATP-binding protein